MIILILGGFTSYGPCASKTSRFISIKAQKSPDPRISDELSTFIGQSLYGSGEQFSLGMPPSRPISPCPGLHMSKNKSKLKYPQDLETFSFISGLLRIRAIQLFQFVDFDFQFVDIAFLFVDNVFQFVDIAFQFVDIAFQFVDNVFQFVDNVFQFVDNVFQFVDNAFQFVDIAIQVC